MGLRWFTTMTSSELEGASGGAWNDFWSPFRDLWGGGSTSAPQRGGYESQFTAIRGDDGDVFVLGPEKLVYGSVPAPQGMLLSDYREPPAETFAPTADELSYFEYGEQGREASGLTDESF